MIGVDPDAGRREIAARCGADACFDPAAGPLTGPILDEQGGTLVSEAGPAVVIEATGSPEVVNEAFALAGHHARVVLLASTRGTTEANFYRDIHRKGLIVLGAHANVRPPTDSSPGYWTLGDDTQTVLRLLAGSRLQVRPLTSEVFAWEEAPRAYQQLASWKKDALGMILRWSEYRDD